MPTTFHLRVWTRFLAPVEDVWRLKTDPVRISEELSPYASFPIQDDAALARALTTGAPGELTASLWL
ncbi:MAG: hypothetical protein ACK59R_01230, partial [Pseudomonadota bacterium]